MALLDKVRQTLSNIGQKIDQNPTKTGVQLLPPVSFNKPNFQPVTKAIQSYQARPSNQIAKTIGSAVRPALEATGTFGNLAYQSIFNQPKLNRQMAVDTQKALDASNRALQAAKAAREAGRPDLAAQYTRSMIPQLQAQSNKFTQSAKEAEAKRGALISSGVRTALYTSAAARLPASIGAGAVGAGLNATIGKQTSPDQIARSFGESFKYGGFPNLSFKGGLLARSLAGGAENLVEDVAYAKLVEGRNLTPREAIISAATPGAFEAIGKFSKQVRKSMSKEVIKKVDPSGLMYNKAGQLFDPINGRWAKNTKEARLAAKNTKDFIASGGVPVKAGTRLVEMSDGKWVDESLINQYKSEIETPKLSVEPTTSKPWEKRYDRKVNDLIENYAKGEEQARKLNDMPRDYQDNPKEANRLQAEADAIERGNQSVVKQLAEKLGISDYEAIDALSTYIDAGKRRGGRTIEDFYKWLPEQPSKPLSVEPVGGIKEGESLYHFTASNFTDEVKPGSNGVLFTVPSNAKDLQHLHGVGYGYAGSKPRTFIGSPTKDLKILDLTKDGVPDELWRNFDSNYKGVVEKYKSMGYDGVRVKDEVSGGVLPNGKKWPLGHDTIALFDTGVKKVKMSENQGFFGNAFKYPEETVTPEMQKIFDANKVRLAQSSPGRASLDISSKPSDLSNSPINQQTTQIKQSGLPVKQNQLSGQKLMGGDESSYIPQPNYTSPSPLGGKVGEVKTLKDLSPSSPRTEDVALVEKQSEQIGKTPTIQPTKPELGTQAVSSQPILSLPAVSSYPRIAKNATEARKLAKKYPGSNIALKSGDEAIILHGPDDGKRVNLKEIENLIYGSESGITAKGTEKSVGKVGDTLRQLEQGISRTVEQGLTSQNPYIRAMANLSQDLIGGLGKSGEQIRTRQQYRGGIDYATKVASDTQNHIYTLIGKDKKSLERVHSVLDPEISKLKIKESDLNPQELEALGTLRQVSDFINDTNYSMGRITKDQWMNNRGGKYIARAYEEFDYPPEVADFVTNKGIKFDLDPFKKRGKVTDWKIEESIKDPAYLMAKRMQQTLFNVEVDKYMQWAKKTGLTSDTAKDGFVQLSDSRAYGDLAGKWIRKDALEDVKGFFATNDIAQKAYELISWYDRNPLRRSLKSIKTVFNPAVRLGNRTGNYVFAWLNGINPATFEKNRQWATKAIKNNDPAYRWAMQQGQMGTDVTKADIARVSAELSREIKDPGKLKQAINLIQESYGRVDDESKLAALKTWIDRGVDPQEALNRVSRGFQDYNMVGMLYDIGAKIPILGNPFVRFASESARIIKNAAVDHPVRLVSTLAAWKLFTDVMSRVSGESPEDREVRENRVGASKLPFSDISTNVQTPWGEVNVSRLLGFSTTITPEGETASSVARYSPILDPTDKRSYASDPLIGPMISLGMDTDFRNKSIADPNQNKYTPSTLTTGEQNLNRLGFLARAYTPPTATDVYNIGAAAQGKENVYGQKKTLAQSLLRTYPGVKVEQFGPAEAQKQRERNAYFEGQKNETIEKQINSVKKQQLKGEITEEQATKRIDSLQGKMTTVPTTQKEGEISYIRSNDGSMQTIKLSDLQKPTGTTLKDYLSSGNRESTIREIYKAYAKGEIDDKTMNKAFSGAGVSVREAENLVIATLPTQQKATLVYDRLVSPQSQLKDLEELVSSKLLTTAVIKEMKDTGKINDQQESALKNYLKQKSGKVSKGKKPKKFKPTKFKSIKLKGAKKTYLKQKKLTLKDLLRK